MTVLQNLDLLSVGIAIAAIGILGFVIFLNNRKSITSWTFLLFSLVTISWGSINYANYQTLFSIPISFWLLKATIFLGAWHSFSFFQLSYVFPEEQIVFPKWYKRFLVPWIVFVSILTLTPFVFNAVAEISSEGRITHINNGPGIALFGFTVLVLVIGGISLLVRKTIRSKGVEKKQFFSILIGVVLTFTLLMTFNFILPAFYDNPQYIPYGAVFLFPFVAFTAYAILKHHLLGVRVIATEILTFVLSVVVLYEVIFADSLAIRVLRSGVFLLVLSFGILLIKSVRREVEQRERMERMTAELEHVNERLKELDHLKSEFLNFASHQVKSPMATVKGFATLIEDGTYGAVSDKTKEAAHKIREGADRLIRLVNNLLDLGRIEAGKLDFTMQEMDIVKLLRDMVDEYQILAQNRRLALTFETSTPSLTIKADAEKLRQVIQNLIDNSIKYTESGWIKVTFREEKATLRPGSGQANSKSSTPSGQPLVASGSVLITVSDSGRGMSPELLQKLFGRFVRDEKTKTEVIGTGLGLYIAKQIVLAHHGEIWAESEGVGKGSKFFVRIGKG